MSAHKIKVLVVEDSSVVRMFLVHLLGSDPRIHVIGTASNGREAIDMLSHKSPDLILMDIDMPEMDGFEATRRIMETHPVPIVICTATQHAKESVTAFRMMEAGAVACIEKPTGHEQEDFKTTAANLLQTVKLMAEVKVVRRWPKSRREAGGKEPIPESRPQNHINMIAIGASTGGPPVLQTIFTALPKDFAAPLLVVQHIAPGFLEGLVQWLNQTTGLKVHIAAYGIEPLPGHAYLAPDDYHMALRSDGRIILNKKDPESGLRPAVSHLFRSVAEVSGSNAIGVLLTGMGKDGAQELKTMKNRGALTIVQDKESSVVHGMPGEAIALNAASLVLPPDRIAAVLAGQTAQPIWS